MKALLGLLIGLLIAPAPAWGQTATAIDGLESIADSQRYRARAVPPPTATQCRERDRSFSFRTRMSPAQRREALDRCLAVAQAWTPAPAVSDPVAEGPIAVR